MKKRILLIAGAVVLLLILIAAIGWWWLTATRSGATFVLGQIQSRVESMEWSRLEGGLRGGVVVHDLQLRQAGLEVTADRVALAARVRPAPPFDVRIDRLTLDNLVVTLPPADPDAPSEPFVLGDYRLPVPVQVDEFQLDGLDVTASDGSPVVRVDRASLAGSAQEALTLDRFELAAPQGQLRMNGSAGLADPWALDLDLSLRPELPESELAADLSLDGPLQQIAVAAQLSGDIRAELTGEVRGLPDPAALTGTIELNGSVERWPGLPGRLAAIEVTGEGGLQAWQALVRVEPELDGVPVTEAVVEAEGGPDAIDRAVARIWALDGEVIANGRFGWADALGGSATVRVDDLDFTALYPEWPNQARLDGRTEIELAAGEVIFRDLALNAQPTTLEVTGQGRYRLEDQYASVALDWTDLTWPPVLGAEPSDEPPLFSSESGHFEGRGTLAEWQAEVAAWLQVQDQPRTRIEVDAEGDEAEARILRGLVRPEGAGELGLTGRAGLAMPVSANLDLTLSGFDPGALVPQLPGRIDGRARLELEDTASVLTIDSLSGQLRGQPLGGSGTVAVRQTTVETASLNLSLGENQASIQRPSDAQWTVEIAAPRLDQLWPTLAGALTAEATVVAAEQRVEWTLDSPGLIFGQRRAGALTSRGVANWGEVPGATARITAEDVDLNPWERLDRVEFVVAGTCAAHRVNAYASGTRATIDLAAGGALADCADPTGAWSGQIDRMVIAETQLGLWQLDRPLKITRTSQGVNTRPACLWTVAHDGRLCLNALDAGQSDAGPEGRAAVAFNSVPMDLLLLPLDPAFSIGSELRGLAQVNWDAAGLSTFDGRLVLDEGPVRLLGTEGDLLTLNRADLRLTSSQPGAVRADLALRLEGQSEIGGYLLIPDLTDPASATVDSRLSLKLPRLSAFNRLIPQLDSLQGQLDAELVIAGPLQAPEFDGQASVTNGRVHQAPLGMDLTDIDLRLDADETGGRLTGSFRAGEGTGRLDGRVVAEAGDWSGTVSVAGERLGVFDTDWLKMQVSPDLTADFDPERLALDGTLVLDSARLGLPPGTEQRVSPSPDVVVVGDDEEASDTGGRSTRPITGSIAFRLGDDVRLEAAGMETRLAGGLDITWAGNRAIPTADGKIELVDGAYRAYGQNLDVQRGDVIFTGNPIDNPVLDIAAVREIFGDPAVEFAGVEIRGPAQDPEIELFTSPPTSPEKALAYVLTGAEFDHAAGQGAFNVGFWVLPNVFVSYGIGLFDSGNVLAARWDLSRRWGLRATSGESDTGADVSFIIDR